MKAVFYILTKPPMLHELLDAIHESGINGGTIFETKGMGTEMARQSDFKISGFLRSILSSSDELKHSNTLMFVLPDEKVPTLVQAIKSVTGDLSAPGTGIIFSVPIDFIEGLKT